MSISRMPCAFIGHGSPMNTLEDNRYTRAWAQLGAMCPKPSTILCVSAHWVTQETAVTAMKQPRTVHDFRGFPPALHAVQYPAPGNPALARRIQSLMAPEVDVRLDEQEWGLDHGTWSVLKHMYPNADVPVVQLSLNANAPAEAHYRMARQLAPLRDEGVFIVATGNVVHNLRTLSGNKDAPAHPWAERFNQHMRAHLLERNHEALVHLDFTQEDTRLSVPDIDHYWPLLYVLALQTPSDRLTILIDGIELASISMLSILLQADP